MVGQASLVVGAGTPSGRGEAPLVVGMRRPSWWVPFNNLTPKICLGALFGPNEVLETHVAPFLDQL